jgi:hypothetical protein
MRIPRSTCLLVVATVVIALFFCPSVALPKDSSHDGIAFLTLLVTPDHVQLVDWTIVKGQLRQPRTPADKGDLKYEAVTTSGAVVWSGSLADPLVRRLEYEDPDNPGQLKARHIRLDSVQFVVRVPVDSAIQEIVFFRTERQVEKGMAVRKPVGAIACPWREVKK